MSGPVRALAFAPGSALSILTDLVEDHHDNGDYRLNISGMSLAMLWEAVEIQENELCELRKDKARLDSGEIMHFCCGDRVHFVKRNLRADIDEALSPNTEVRDGAAPFSGPSGSAL